MALTFLCPNGHRLSCADEQAGLAGQCPECGVRFRIPLPEQPDDASAATEEPADEGEGYGEEAAGDEPAAQPAPERIVFLCPNGHRLFGPPHLAGRAGQCPHCGTKFRIPPLEEAPTGSETSETADDESGNEEYAGDVGAGELEAAEGEQYESYESVEEFDATAEPSANGSGEYDEDLAVEDADLLSGDAADEEDSPNDAIWPGTAPGPAAMRRRSGGEFLGFGSTVEVDDDGTPSEPSASLTAELPHPMAELCDRLWAEIGDGVKIEVVLKDGKHLAVHHFARGWSQRSHGLFAYRESDGTYTLTAVAWQSISRITVRGVAELAEDLG